MTNTNEYREHIIMRTSRRRFLQACGIGGAATLMTPAFGQPITTAMRTFHFSTSCGALEADPELLESVARAGVTDVWLSGFWIRPMGRSTGNRSSNGVNESGSKDW